MHTRKIDRFFLIVTILLCLVGFLVFTSASLGLLGRNSGNFTYIAAKQFLILCVGLIVMFVVSKVNYRYWKKLAPIAFAVTVILTGLVLVPGLGIEIGGAKRWLDLKFTSLQPSEFLKLGTIMFAAAWFSVRGRAANLRTGLIPFLIITGIGAGLLLAQPDTGTFMVLFFSAFFTFWAAGAKKMHVALIILLAILSIGVLAYTRPYVRDRITTFIDPSNDSQGSSYQVNQSLFAIGSGGIAGRGFGQSVQKFNYLPEPIGDSIYAVAGEEFGFIGTSGIVFLFLLFGLLGLKISLRTTDLFGRLLAGGIAILITSQAAINMASMLGLIPLTGVPLPFISHGGTSLITVLIGAGIIMNISRQKS